MGKKVPQSIKCFRWIVTQKWKAKKPIGFSVLFDEWYRLKCCSSQDFDTSRIIVSKRGHKNCLETKLSKPEKLMGFTNEQKIHLLWISSLPVSEPFETILKSEGNLIELTDPERLVTFYRSRDGNFERRATYPLEQDGNDNEQDEKMDDVDSLDDQGTQNVKTPTKRVHFPRTRPNDAVRMLNWLAKHLEFITNPISPTVVSLCWMAKIPGKVKRNTMPRTAVKLLRPAMKHPESVTGFTTVQKAQLMFVLSLPVNETFESLIKHEGHQIELTDPKRLITFFRSSDGTVERRATLQQHQGVYEPPVVTLDDDDEDFDYKGMELNQYYDQSAVVKEEPQEVYTGHEVRVKEEPQDEYTGEEVTVKEEPQDEYYDGMGEVVDAPMEWDQQGIKEERGGVMEPEAGPSIANPIKQEPVIDQFYPQQLAPIESFPTIYQFLRTFRASVMALRSPSLTGTRKTIEEALAIHGNNTNPVPVTDVALNIPSIIYLALKGEPKNKKEEQISQKAYLQLLLRLVILLESSQLKKFQEQLELEIDQVDDMAKIRLENLKNGLSTLLVAITA